MPFIFVRVVAVNFNSQVTHALKIIVQDTNLLINAQHTAMPGPWYSHVCNEMPFIRCLTVDLTRPFERKVLQVVAAIVGDVNFPVQSSPIRAVSWLQHVSCLTPRVPGEIESVHISQNLVSSSNVTAYKVNKLFTGNEANSISRTQIK